MKGVMKGKMMKKLKSIKPIEYIKAEKILQAHNFNEFVENFPKTNLNSFKLHIFKDQDAKRFSRSKTEAHEKASTPKNDSEDKENIRPSISNQNQEISVSSDPDPRTPLSDLDLSSFRRPDMNSVSLFDPKLLAAFEEALTQYDLKWSEEEGEESFPLLNFQEKCPPGGIHSVILYTTSLRGIRKTFEDCHSIRFLLESFRLIFQERDISIHSEFREELWRTLGEKCVPPRLFVMGRYIGGAEEVLSLNERGKLKPIFEGVPRREGDSVCEGCGGFRFVVCVSCSGSTRVFDCGEEDGDCGGAGGLLSRRKCLECNENGLIVCPCCS